ncbi:MAG: GNAT family N-acetyltransferase [Alphaproteobacteria bacterium]
MTPPPRVRIEALAEVHARARFSCGVRRIDAYLSDALELQSRGLSRVFVAVEPGDRIVRGYYALQARHVVGADVPQPLGRQVRLDARIPVVELVMLGVARRHQERGIGKALLADALRRVKRTARDIGIWAVVLEALDEQAEAFYRRLGFATLIDGRRTMFLAVAGIA